jgi:hypothetical protein
MQHASGYGFAAPPLVNTQPLFGNHDVAILPVMMIHVSFLQHMISQNFYKLSTLIFGHAINLMNLQERKKQSGLAC